MSSELRGNNQPIRSTNKRKLKFDNSSGSYGVSSTRKGEKDTEQAKLRKKRSQNEPVTGFGTGNFGE